MLSRGRSQTRSMNTLSGDSLQPYALCKCTLSPFSLSSTVLCCGHWSISYPNPNRDSYQAMNNKSLTGCPANELISHSWIWNLWMNSWFSDCTRDGFAHRKSDIVSAYAAGSYFNCFNDKCWYDPVRTTIERGRIYQRRVTSKSRHVLNKNLCHSQQVRSSSVIAGDYSDKGVFFSLHCSR